MLAAWLLTASRRADTYRQHRTLLVLLFKTLLAATVLHLTNDGGRMVGSSADEPSSTVLLVKATSLHGLVHLPALCVGLPLPFWLQLGWVLGRTAIFCLGRASRGAKWIVELGRAVANLHVEFGQTVSISAWMFTEWWQWQWPYMCSCIVLCGDDCFQTAFAGLRAC